VRRRSASAEGFPRAVRGGSLSVACAARPDSRTGLRNGRPEVARSSRSRMLGPSGG